MEEKTATKTPKAPAAPAPAPAVPAYAPVTTLRSRQADLDESKLEELTLRINRSAKVVKGGRRFSFSAMVVLGDREGHVGLGYGKANQVPIAIEKSQKDAKKSIHKVSVIEGTIPHEVTGIYGSSKIRLIPASEGTGIKAGATARSVLELAGVKNILTKSLGSNNPVNLAKATLDGLIKLKTKEEIQRIRQISV